MKSQTFALDADTRLNTRKVQHLRLRAPRHDAAERARIALEDGLATADFKDAGRLILVRQLSLRRLTVDLNGPAAARAIEASFRALASAAVYGGDPHASTADIVWFADLVEARIEALSLLVEDRPLADWFWRRALGPLLADGATIPALIEAIATSGTDARGAPGMIALVQRWRRWSAAGFARFLKSLPSDPSTISGHATGRSGEGDTYIYSDHTLASVHRALERAKERLQAAAELGSQKAEWIARWELVESGVLPLTAGPLPPALVGSLIAGILERHASARVDDKATAEPWPRPQRATVLFAPHMQSDTRDAAPANPVSPETPGDSLSLSPYEFRPALPPWLSNAAVSEHAGFFMMLNAWKALGFPEWLDTQAPDIQETIGRTWLDRWALRLRMPAMDVQRAAWRPPHAQVELPTSLAMSLADWMSRTRRWLRTRAHIGPASVVLRKGAVCITRTHVDVVFPLNALDIRVRRAGLDCDPGWVAWLGRIVTFHFVDE